MDLSRGFVSLVFLLGLAVGSAAHADNTDCIPAADIQDIAKYFPQFEDLANKGEYCPDGSAEARLLQGIMFMRNTHFASTMPKSPDELFSGTFAKDWWSYFTGRINEFSVEDDCPKGVVAFVYSFGGNTMYVCPAALTDSFTSLDLSSVFMHEARHIDGYPHITCSRGPRAGLQGACDENISDTGSYAVTVETYAQLAKYGDQLHPALRAYARSASVIYADEAFETPVQITRQQQFLVMTSTKEIYKLNLMNGTVLTKLGDSPALGHVVMRSQHMILFPEDKTLPAKFLFARNEGEINQQAGDLAAEYSGQTPAQRAEVVDFHIGAQWSARVVASKVRFSCNPRAAGMTELNLPSGEAAAGLIYPTGYDRAARVVNLITQSGHILEIGCDTGYQAFVRTSNLVLDRPYKRIHKAGDNIVGLSADGHLYKINGTTSTSLATDVDGQVAELVPNQNVEFFDSAN